MNTSSHTASDAQVIALFLDTSHGQAPELLTKHEVVVDSWSFEPLGQTDWRIISCVFSKLYEKAFQNAMDDLMNTYSPQEQAERNIWSMSVMSR